MKRIMIIVLAVALAATGMVSCKKGGNQIEIWHIQMDGDGPGTFQRAAQRFERANPSVKVKIEVMANDAYKNRLAVAMGANKMPDLFLSWSGGPMYEYANNNKIMDLTSYMNANNYKNRFLDAGIAQASYKGKIWGVPVTNVSVCTVFYNKDMFRSLNIRVPTTLSEFEAACGVLKANGVTPFSLANKTQWTGSMYFMFLATRNGGTQPFINAVDGSGTFMDPAFIFAGNKIQEWVNKGYFLEGFNGLDWDSGQARAPLYRGETAMLIMGSWFVSQAKDESPEFFPKMGIFTFPRDDRGSGNPGTVIGTVGDNFYHISATSKNPDKAFELLTFLMDDDGVKDMLNDGKIPPVKGVNITDPLLSELFAQVQAAPDMQLWYDQSLSPEVADVHKVTSQEIFGLQLTSEQAAQRLQDAQANYLRTR
jgi:raffinose/stachyose/melibiose transport system substrate-binding protein